MTTTTTTTSAPAPSTSDAVRAASVEVVRLLQQLERPDLAGRVTAAAARLQRPATIVAVVGEFKQGKSSLVNGLLGQAVCPVDDDLATSAITLVRHGERPGAIVRRSGDGGPATGPIPVTELHEWVSEAGNPGNEKGVERVEITVPSAILSQGLVIVDTPGMGGLGAGHAAATLAFLPFADGLILVSDASSELSAPEIDLLRQAVELCPTVLFALTKIDLYPEWQRIQRLNEAHLERAGLRIPMVPVSSQLRNVALARKDRSLNDASRFPELISHLGDKVVTPAKEHAAARSAGDVRSVARLVRSALEQQRQLVDDPSAIVGAVAALERAQARLEHLRGPAARWSVLVNDRIADLTNSVTHQLRSGMREVSREMDARIEALTKGDEWDAVTRELQTQVADHVTRAFVAVEQGDRAIRAAAAELLAEEELDLGGGRGVGARAIDVSTFWQDKGLGDETGVKSGLKTALTAARGAQGGVIMFGMMGSFLPGAAAALIATNPVLLGAGALLGGVQLMEDRKRKVAMRRQNARQQVRQFVDDVQFEVTNELTGLIRETHRDIRDTFTARLTELQRTYTAAAQQAQATAKETQEQLAARRAQLDQQLAQLARIEESVPTFTAGGGR